MESSQTSAAGSTIEDGDIRRDEMVSVSPDQDGNMPSCPSQSNDEAPRGKRKLTSPDHSEDEPLRKSLKMPDPGYIIVTGDAFQTANERIRNLEEDVAQLKSDKTGILAEIDGTKKILEEIQDRIGSRRTRQSHLSASQKAQNSRKRKSERIAKQRS
ncbi:hypothetical protein DM02DRAFT_661335 [Periconia macrospinosa]|uniref:Uncharacterized protein n=1 Tax=Periconia macrospinosa TaxID=97972 RepID=A0A2V1D7L4_9PLEO|nr:hypothetical protein DM02DRAFT_661335 [Periconia macrospinosa]